MFTSQGGSIGLQESFEYRVQLLAGERFAGERSAFPQDYAELLRVAFSVAPSRMELPSFRATQQRQRRLVPALKAASGFAGLVLSNPIRNAGSKGLSIFSLFSDNCVLEKNVRNLPQRQQTVEQSLRRVQGATDEKFFLLGIEIIDTQKNVEALQDVFEARLMATGKTVRQLSSQLNIMGDCVIVRLQFDSVADENP